MAAVLRVSATVDYALRAAIVLARAQGQPVTASEIATTEDLPGKFLAATLASMRQAGLLCSRRGGSGGFWLSRPAEEITVADLVRAIDGSVVDLSAVRGGATAAWWAAAAASIEASLSGVSLAELAQLDDLDLSVPGDASSPGAARS